MRKIVLSICAVLMVCASALAQDLRITGTVSTSEGTAAVGATVSVVGTTDATITDINGDYEIMAPANATLSFSYVGMKTVDLAVAGRTNINVTLDAEATKIDELIVVAYGAQKKESITGAVASVSAEAIEKRTTSTPVAALEGASAGVQVNNTYGEPGSAPTIRIRGFTTINGSNSPLYVVDGVPFAGSISDLNNADIESMSVLKDAASAALYGNRASNGVILITTKKGKQNTKTSVSFSANMGVYTLGIEDYDKIDTDTWMEVMYTGLKNQAMTNPAQLLDNAAAAAYAKENLINEVVKVNIYDKPNNELFDDNGKLVANKLPGYNDLDWFSAMERPGVRQEYNITASNATNRFSIFSSLSYLNEEGYIIATDYERYTGRFNAVYTPNNWLQAGMNLSGTSYTQHGNDTAYGNYYANPFYTARMQSPVYPIYQHNADGSIITDAAGEKVYNTGAAYLDNRHIIYEYLHDVRESKGLNLNGQVFASAKFLKDFTFTVKADLNLRNTSAIQFDNPEIGDGAAHNGRLNTTNYTYKTYTVQQQLTWAKSFDLHNVDVLLAHENYSNEYSYLSTMKNTAIVDGLYVPSNFTNTDYVNGADNAYRLESYLMRARYNFDEKYFADFSFRADGSSRFHPDNRWGEFWSIGGSWMISKEEFMANNEQVNDLKLRASYGEVGNDASVGYYGYMALYDIDKNGGKGSFIKNSLAADDIQWETAQSFDIALEGRLLDRIDFSVDYFNKTSKDLLFEVKLPSSAGGYPWNDSPNMSILRNIGSIENKGIEIDLNVELIKAKNFKWTVGGNATFMKNTIIELPEENRKDGILSGSRKYMEGHSIYEWFTYHYEGIDMMDGHSLYTLDDEKYVFLAEGETLAEGDDRTVVDAKGARRINGVDYALATTYAKRDFRGSILPDVYGSFNTALTMGNLTLSALFTYSLGGLTYDSTYAGLLSTAANAPQPFHVDVLKSWTAADGEGITETSANRINPTGTPVFDFYNYSDNNGMSDRWLQDASYLVIKNINLSYNIPARLLERLHIGSASINIGVENLATFTTLKGMNPQYSFTGGQDMTYGTARVMSAGLKLNF